MKLTAARMLVSVLLVNISTASLARAMPGDVDSLDASIVGRGVKAIAVQPDGKTIIGGNFTSVLGQARYNIARLNSDGTLDAGFNPNVTGTVGISSGTTNLASVNCVAVQTDGKILIGGNFTTIGGTVRNLVARLTADGMLDASFNRNFTFSINVFSAGVNSMAVLADGRLLIAGGLQVFGSSGIERSIIERLEADGTHDPSFDPNVGTEVTTTGSQGTIIITNLSGIIDCLAIQADGKILFAGDFASVGGINRRTIVRVAADGALDQSFIPNLRGSVKSIVVQPNGQLLLGGNLASLEGSTYDSLLRVETDGTLDSGFNPNANGDVHCLAVQADGKILLGGGFTMVGGIARNNIARVAADGTLDGSFNPNANGTVYGVTLQADGRFMLAGLFTSVGGTVRDYFARLLNDTATQTLNALDSSHVLWTRGGTAPEIYQTTFELSTDGGSSYAPLGGIATRVGSTADWQITGLSLPASGQIRARGRTFCGSSNGSSQLVDQIMDFSLSLQAWRQTHFGTQANAGNAADTADFDQDGLVNLVEYAFGLSPTLASNGHLPQPSFNGSSLEYSFTEFGGVSGITFGAEWSETLLPGSWTDIPDNGTAPQHFFTVPPGGNGKKFIRLKVTKN